MVISDQSKFKILDVQVVFKSHTRGGILVRMMVMIKLTNNPLDSFFQILCGKAMFSKCLDIKTRCAKLFAN